MNTMGAFIANGIILKPIFAKFMKPDQYSVKNIIVIIVGKLDGECIKEEIGGDIC